jgi:anti-sigma factor RsiW
MFWFRRSVHPEEELSAYVDGELGERARGAVERHLASCEACSALLRELQDAKSLLSELPKPRLRHSLALGPEFAVERRPALAPHRSPFSFAPAVALTVLVALLFVDAANFSDGGSDDSGTFTAASRAAEPEAGGGAVLESTKVDESPNAADSAAGAGPQDGDDARDSSAGAAGAAELAPAEDGSDAGSPDAAQAPPSGTVGPEEAPQPLTIEAEDQDGIPEDTSLFSEANDSSGGLSTLRILEIAAAIAFAVSLLVVFLPRFTGRSER